MLKKLTMRLSWLTSNKYLAVAIIGLFAVIGFATLIPVFAVTASNVTVNFDSLNAQPLSPNAFSGTISTYKGDGQTITNNTTVSGNLHKLGLSTYRVPIQFNNGNPISSAGKGPTDITADTWIASIKKLGAEPEIVIGGSPSQPGSHDNNFLPSDAAGLVKYFNTHALDTVSGGTTISHYNPVKYWVIGNEPANLTADNAATYCSRFNTTVDAMKAVDPSVVIIGPAISSLNTIFMKAFLQCAGSKVDIVDYHEYAMGYTYLDNATTLARTHYYSQKITQLRDLINKTVPTYASHIKIQVGEYNFTYRTADGYQGYQGDDRMYQPVLTVWTASVAGHIAQSGAIGHNYSDMSLPLLIKSKADAAHFGQTAFTPMPGYYGLEMFTGGDLFRHFGQQMVTASTSLTNTEVYASTNQKNVVLINKSPSKSKVAHIILNGFNGGSANIWQTNAAYPFAAPKLIKKLNSLQHDLTITLPPYTVTTVVLN
ncbi:MAG TPA: hypothetical protein VNX65_03980 [Patescibacteria group bacterium]|jgi:hypothetical protein|nr:hypothetical protein [Patescibacteria group bacterium]